MWKWKLCLTLLFAMFELIDYCASDGVMQMLSSFIDVEKLAEEAANETAKDKVAAKSVDTTYPLASVEMNALLQMYHDCHSKQSTKLRTWCIGNDEDTFLDENYDDEEHCPRGILTHPCTGRVLHPNTSVNPEFMCDFDVVNVTSVAIFQAKA